ncbi:MAG: FAD-binding oxidoreductase [Pseudomonadota bacterium]
MRTKQSSYWLASAPDFTASPGAPGPRYDVAIVGAGFTGLTAARYLAKSGMRAVVFERGTIGAGASGRNGGHLNNGLAHSYAGAVRAWGPERARRLYHAFDASIDLIETVIEEEQIRCDFHRAGKLKLASKPGHVAGLSADAALIRDGTDASVRFLPREDLGSEIRSDEVHGGVLFPKSAAMHMGRYLTGLADACLRHGAQIFEGCAVKATRRDGEDWDITLASGHVHARHLILAGGATGAGLSPELARQVLPIGSYIIATRPLSEAEIAATIPGRRTYVTSLNVGSYFHLAPDNRLIFGGRARFSARADGAAAARSVPILRRTLGQLFPSLAGIEIEHAFGGLVDMSVDRLPRLGQTQEGAHYALGLSGHGAQISALLGEALARAVLGEEASAYETNFAQMPRRAFPPFARQGLPLLGAYARLRDLLS